VITQSNYIPWKGYFDLIRTADELILLDDVQYTRRDWRNRNRIKTTIGPKWLSIPVRVSGKYTQRIDETEVVDPGWADDHWQVLMTAYQQAPHFAWCAAALEPIYRGMVDCRLSNVNRAFIETVCAMLGITTPIRWSTELTSSGTKTDRLVSLCTAAKASHYLSGPAARAYLEPRKFANAGIELHYFDYSGYPEYPQPHPPFVHEVSVIDLLFNTGPIATAYLERVPRGADDGGAPP
jgi:hypothetical protein